jgi:16S rRNA (adenine1518-N6/adenine1519-N6)-dimethyltransferase
LKVVGNIPYYVTSPLIEKALRPPLPAVIVYLVQREVADRVAARPGGKTYGALTVGVQAVARAERLFVVRAGAFHPPPNVDSAVLRLTPLADPLVDDAERAAFRAFVVGLFGQRRKQIVGGLRTVTALDREGARARCADVGIDPAARAETLSVADFVRLFRASVR